jgi:pSer/pThr/pTyr-binding forkhead associated (FHA) protein
MDARLIVVGGKANKSEVKLKLPATIGRSRTADLTVAHPKVSRQHCQIFERDGMLIVRDNGSLNGTFIEATRITESVLKPGDKLTIGPLSFVAAYEVVAAEAGIMPAVDLPTPIFDPQAAAEESAPQVDASALITEREDDWLGEPPAEPANELELNLEGVASLPESLEEPELPPPPLAEHSLELPPLVDPPVLEPVEHSPSSEPAEADDFLAELAETVPADPQAASPPAADATIDWPAETVEFEAASAAPLLATPEDFCVSDDEAGDAVSSLRPSPSTGAGEIAGELAEISASPESHPDNEEIEAAEEPFDWSPDSSEPAINSVSADTIGVADLDETTEIAPKVAPASASANDQPAARKAWWPFSGKKKGKADRSGSSETNEAKLPEAPSSMTAPAEAIPPAAIMFEALASEAASPPATSPPPTAQDDEPSSPSIDESAEAQANASADDEELSQFLKSLGQ